MLHAWSLKGLESVAGMPGERRMRGAQNWSARRAGVGHNIEHPDLGL